MSINPNNQKLLNSYKYYLNVELNDNKTKREKTVDSYYSDTVQFVHYLGELDCLDLELEHANEWLKSLAGKDGGKIKASTRNKKIAGLNNFYRYLIEIKKVKCNNPFDGLKPEKIKKGEGGNQTTRDFLEKDEVRRFKKVLEEDVKNPRYKKGCVKGNVKMNALRNRALFNLILCSGMRVEEACGLELHEIEVNPVKNVLIITIPIEKDKGKRGRVIPVPIYVMEYINEYRNNLTFKTDSNYVFLSQNGKKLDASSVAFLLSGYTERAKIVGKHITPHSLRHTYGTHMVNDPNNSIMAVAKIMGHRDAKQLQDTYYHLSDEIQDVIFKI